MFEITNIARIEDYRVMRLSWIDEQLEARGLPRRALVDVLPGMTEQKMSLVMSGKRRLTLDEGDAIRRFFGYRLPDDPPRNRRERIVDQLNSLGEHQERAVALYLEALLGNDAGHKTAS